MNPAQLKFRPETHPVGGIDKLLFSQFDTDVKSTRVTA
jgi:hypothetical protein